MHLEIVGGDYYGYVEDRFGRELVDAAIRLTSRRNLPLGAGRGPNPISNRGIAKTTLNL